MNLKIRPYRPGDEISISEMFTRNTPYMRDNNFWIWMNRILPLYPSLIAVVADENENICGHTAIMPNQIKVGERIIKCGMGYHTIIDKEYQDLGLIIPLLELSEKMAVEQGLEFFYGFPNKKARPLYKLPNHYKIERFLALEKESNIEKWKSNEQMYSFEKIKKIDYNFLFSLNHLLDLRKKDIIEIYHHINYYCARYFFHPQKLYNSYNIFYKNEFVGCLVTKIYEKEGKKYFHIIDLLIDENIIDVYTLLKDIVSYFSEICDIFSFWKITEKIKNILLEIGFLETGFDSFLGICFLANNKITENEKQLLLDFKNWRLVMGDSDAF